MKTCKIKTGSSLSIRLNEKKNKICNKCQIKKVGRGGPTTNTDKNIKN